MGMTLQRLLLVLLLLTGAVLETKDLSAAPTPHRLEHVNYISGAVHHNAQSLVKIREREKHATDAREKALLAGLEWMVFFIDDDKNFRFIFSDLIVMLAELMREHEFPVVAKISTQLQRDSLQRASISLMEIFTPDQAGKWEFISVLPYLLSSDVGKRRYVRFYKNFFPPGLQDYMRPFKKALKKRDIDALGDYLIDYTFLNLLRKQHPDFPVGPSTDHLNAFISLIQDVPLKHRYRSDLYHDQNYFVTHVVFVLSNYGTTPLKEGKLEKRLYDYLKKHYPIVRNKVGDLDLLAEYVNCFKLYGEKNSTLVREAERYMIGRQLPSGVWGERSDFDGDPYDQFHPTWAVMTGLVRTAGFPKQR